MAKKIISRKQEISYIRKSIAFCFEKNYFQKITINSFYINKIIIYNYNSNYIRNISTI